MRRYYFWRQNNGGVFNAKRGAYQTNPNTVKGVADIFVLTPKRIVALEVKSEKGLQSLEQITFSKYFDNGLSRQYYVVRSVEEVMARGL